MYEGISIKLAEQGYVETLAHFGLLEKDAGRIGDVARKALQATRSGAKTVADKARSGAQTVSDKARSGAQTVSDKARSGAQTVSDKARSGAQTVSDKARSGAQTVSDKARSGAKTVADKARSATSKKVKPETPPGLTVVGPSRGKRVKDWASKNKKPLAIGGGAALAAGAGAGGAYAVTRNKDDR